MSLNRRQFVAIGSAVLLPLPAARAEEIYESVYNYIIVSQTGSVIALRQMENSAVTQSAIDLDHPTFQVLPYTRWLFAAALFDPKPQAVLGLGLGAGAFNRLFNVAFPEAVLTTVEIDPMMLRIAEKLTRFATGPRNRVVISDARLFLRRSDARWDWIILDAYVRNSQIPPHLTTLEFFHSVIGHLRPGGVFAVNIVGPDPLFYALVNTLQRVFANNAAFAVPGTGNRIFLGATEPGLALAIDRGPVDLPQSLQLLLAKNGVDFAAIRKSRIAVAVPPGTPVLTDDFAPSEYLGSHWGNR